MRSTIFRYIGVTLAILLLKVHPLPVPYDDSELLNPSTLKRGEPISEYTFHLQEELSSLMILQPSDPDSQEMLYQPDHDILIIPRSHITERTLNSLGYKDLVKYGKKFKYDNTYFRSHLEILIPEKAVPYFIFNSSEPLNVPKSQSRVEYANFIDHSAPFTLPGFSALTDYMMILPIPKGFDPDSLTKSVLTLNSSKLPMFAHAVREGSPLIVFFFKSGPDVVDGKYHSESLMNLKSFVTNHELNGFFDAFALTWIEDISMSQLLHGVFCTVNVASQKQSFCMRIKDDLNNLILFPAYEHCGSKHKRDFVTSGKKAALRKRAERINTKMIPTDRNVQYEPIEELTIPLSIVKENRLDPKDQGYIPRTRKMSSIQSSSKSVQQEKLVRRLTGDDGNHVLTKTQVENILMRLEDRLEQKNIKDKKIRESLDTYVKSKLGSRVKAQTGRAKHTSKASNIKVGSKDSRRKVKFVANSSPNDGQDLALEWNEQLKKQKQEQSNPVKLQSSAGTHKDSSSGNSTSSLDADCEPITWFNVFHHSVFGKTKFCGV